MRWLLLVLCLGARAAAAQDAGMPPATLSLSGDGEVATLVGSLGHGSAGAFAQLAVGAPQLRLLRLDSPGGFVEEARSIAAIVGRLRLDTYVARLCASACTQVFYAGAHRWLRPEARMGFHSYGIVKGQTATDDQIEAAEDVERRSYAQGGLASWFVDHIFSTPNKGIWLPTAQEMLAARFATDVTVEENPLDHELALPGLPRVNHPVAEAGLALPRVIGP